METVFARKRKRDGVEYDRFVIVVVPLYNDMYVFIKSSGMHKIDITAEKIIIIPPQ